MTDPKLIELLKQYDSQSMPFAQAKEKLLAKGYDDVQIAHALYSVSYDGKPNRTLRKDPVAKYYAENPQEADRIAKYMLTGLKQRNQAQDVANYVASRTAPGPHARSVFSLRFADGIGFPFFTFLFLSAGGAAFVLVRNLPYHYIYIGMGLFVVGWLALKLLSRHAN